MCRAIRSKYLSHPASSPTLLMHLRSLIHHAALSPDVDGKVDNTPGALYQTSPIHARILSWTPLRSPCWYELCGFCLPEITISQIGKVTQLSIIQVYEFLRLAWTPCQGESGRALMRKMPWTLEPFWDCSPGAATAA